MAVIVLESLAVLLAAVVVVAGPGVKPADAATSRQQIVAVAQAEVGASEANGGCLRYGPCMGYPWCAVFVEWVWRTAGVSPVPTSHTATDLAQWGLDRGLFKPRPAGGVGDAQPGDLAVFGEPGSGTGGHVALVVSNNGDGTITTIGGNESNSVRRSTIYPATHRSGTRNVLISGYVAPPGLGSAPPGPPPLGNGSIIARNNGDGTYLEAVLAGWHAFPITQQDKAALGLGQAYVVPTDQFNLFLIAPVAEGTVLATKTAAGNWVEAVSAGGHAFPISQADKADLNLGDATKIPLRYFEGMAGGLISNGTIIAKKTSTGAWVEAITAGLKAFGLTQTDKQWLGLGDATPIPARYFDGLAAAPIADRTVVAKRVASGAWMEAVTAGGKAFVLSSADKAELGLGHANRIPERSFDALLDKMIDDGTVVAKRTDSGAWMEALTVGGKAFGLSSADKADLGLGSAVGIPARGFDSLAAASVADGTIIAKKTSTGAWVEALVVGGKAYGITQTDKTDLGLGRATAMPARYFDGLASVTTIGNGTVIAKKTSTGAWVEALTAGGHAFGLTQDDKAWLGLGRATPIPTRYFDLLVNTPIAEGTVIARRNENNTYLEAYIVNGRAIPLTQEEKIRLGLGRATLIPTTAFNALL